VLTAAIVVNVCGEPLALTTYWTKAAWPAVTPSLVPCVPVTWK
jgi:hypothetical protein